MSHIHEKIDYTVEVFIVRDGKVLLRVHDKYGFWCSVGGHIELHEDPVEAAHREVKEESGLNIELVGASKGRIDDRNIDLIPPMHLSRNRISDTHEHVTFVYAATTNQSEIIPGEGESVTDFHWFTVEDLQNPPAPHLLPENIRYYAEQALQIAA